MVGIIGKKTLQVLTHYKEVVEYVKYIRNIDD